MSFIAPIVRALSRVWRVCFRHTLHLRELCLAFGACRFVFCSNRESLVSYLERVGLHSAPFARGLSRFWRVIVCVLLHLRELCLVFGGCRCAFRSICESALSCLEHSLVSGIRARIERMPRFLCSRELRFALTSTSADSQQFVAILVR